MQPKINDIVFDFCGVLLDWRPDLALRGEYPQGVIDMFFDPDDPWGFDYYDQLCDAGWSEREILLDYEKHHGPAVAWVFRVYFDHFERAFHGLIPGMGDLLRDLDAAGVGVWGLTNFTKASVDEALRRFSELAFLHDVIISAEERLIKPDPRIYQLALRRFGLDAERTVFVDDRIRNVEAARHCGIHGIEFVDARQLRHDLQKIGLSL
ncbi:MAG: HAD family phosphatase [Bifidobacterium sp.]|uniref:HAD family hydrolase n=1 Tax=Bifidobacterium sp. TaxID=41200 RepID=UPI0039EB6F10